MEDYVYLPKHYAHSVKMFPCGACQCWVCPVCLGVYPKSLAQALANRSDGDGDSLANGWV